jgi:hypothetical protein
MTLGSGCLVQVSAWYWQHVTGRLWAPHLPSLAPQTPGPDGTRNLNPAGPGPGGVRGRPGPAT